jgi:hypothetical protein
MLGVCHNPVPCNWQTCTVVQLHAGCITLLLTTDEERHERDAERHQRSYLRRLADGKRHDVL